MSTENESGCGCFGLLGFVQIILILLKCAGVLMLSWGQVFTPTWICLAIYALLILAILGED